MYEYIIIYTGENFPMIYRRVPYTLIGDYIGEGVVAEANRRVLAEDYSVKYFSLPMFSADNTKPFKFQNSSEAVGFNLKGDHCHKYLGDELPDILDIYYGYYTKEFFMRIGPNYGDLINRLMDFCAIDESVLSEVEHEWQDAAFNGVVDDIQRKAQRDYSLYVSKRRVIRALNKALDECRVEWVYEYNSAYLSGIDVIVEMVRQEMGN